MIIDCQDDYYRPVVDTVREQDAEKKKAKRESFMKSMPINLGKFQKMLEDNNGGDGYFVGDHVSAAFYLVCGDVSSM